MAMTMQTQTMQAYAWHSQKPWDQPWRRSPDTPKKAAWNKIASYSSSPPPPPYYPEHHTQHYHHHCHHNHNPSLSQLTTVKGPVGEDSGTFDLSSRSDSYKLRSHLSGGTWVDIHDLEFGDVVNMCSSHESQGPALRYYQFWKMVTVDGRACPLFLCQITNGWKGPVNGRREYFQTAVSFKLKIRSERNVFVDPCHSIVVIPPSHGKIFVQRQPEHKESPRELKALQTHLDHLTQSHPVLFQRLISHMKCDRQEMATKATIDCINARGKEKCCSGTCGLHSEILGRAMAQMRRLNEFKSYTHNGPKMNCEKIRPPTSLCSGDGGSFAKGQELVEGLLGMVIPPE